MLKKLERGPHQGWLSLQVPPLKPIGIGPRKRRMLDRVLLRTYVQLLERVHPSMGMVNPDLEGMLEIVHRWNPLN